MEWSWTDHGRAPVGTEPVQLEWGVARTMVDLSKGTAQTLSLSGFDGMELD